MYRILFVCHGNICRSPMAEFIFRDMLEKRRITGVEAASAATSTEEIGSGIHPGTAAVLRGLGIDRSVYSVKRARQLTRQDFDRYDLIIGMDSANIRNIQRLSGQPERYDSKIFKLLDFSGRPGDISDPWYTGDFESTRRDVSEGCEGLIEWLFRGGIL